MRDSKPLRVTLVTHYYPAHRGGVERIAGQLAERLAAAGVATFDWHASDCDPPPTAPGIAATPAGTWNGLERAAGVPYPLWTPSALRRLVRSCRASDVVHLHDCLYSGNVVAFVAARRAHRPVLVTQHIGQVPYRNPVTRGLQQVANRAIGPLVLGGTDQVVFESETVRRYFSQFVHFRRPAALVQNGVDTGRFMPATRQERRDHRTKLGVPVDKPLLLFLGRFVEKKGLPVLRALAERLPDIHWLFAGWGPLDPAAWALPNATIVRSPAGEELTRLYQAADLLVLPSVGEGFPLSVQEAMACGTPALVGEDTAQGVPNSEDVLPRERVGDADTVARWATRIDGFIRSSALEALRPRVAGFAREQWSWEQCVARYTELLRACVQ